MFQVRSDREDRDRQFLTTSIGSMSMLFEKLQTVFAILLKHLAAHVRDAVKNLLTDKKLVLLSYHII